MSKFVKAAVATAMLMGALTSASVVAAGNNGTVRFTAQLKTPRAQLFLTIINWKWIWAASVRVL